MIPDTLPNHVQEYLKINQTNKKIVEKKTKTYKKPPKNKKPEWA